MTRKTSLGQNGETVTKYAAEVFVFLSDPAWQDVRKTMFTVPREGYFFFCPFVYFIFERNKRNNEKHNEIRIMCIPRRHDGLLHDRLQGRKARPVCLLPDEKVTSARNERSCLEKKLLKCYFIRNRFTNVTGDLI